MEVHIKRCCGEHAVHLADKNCLYLFCVGLQPYRRVNGDGCKVIWEEFEPIEPEEVIGPPQLLVQPLVC